MRKPVATATLKSTNEKYFLYQIASYTTENVIYTLWVDRCGNVAHCNCPDHVYRHRQCKHMRDLQAEIDTCKAAQRERTAAVAEAERQLAAERAAQKRAAFETVKEQVREIELRYRLEAKRAAFYQKLEAQREAAKKTGGFSLLKVA